MAIIQDGIVYDEQSMNELITKQEFTDHKDRCGKSFDDIYAQLDKFNRAMFGEEDLKRLGAYDMISEIYQSATMSKGAKRMFWTLTKIASGLIAILGALAGGIHVLRKLL